MKKIFFLLVAVFLCPVLLKAQKFHAGPFIGISTSQVSGDYLSGFNKAGLYAGGFVNTELGKQWDAQLEITYIGKGSRPTDDDIQANPYLVYPTLGYAEVPLLVVYKVKPKLHIEGGGAIGILVYSREDDSYSEVPIDMPYDKMDFSFLIGLDYFLTEKLSLDSRWINSFIPIREHASGQTYRFNQGQYNTVITFSLRWHL